MFTYLIKLSIDLIQFLGLTFIPATIFVLKMSSAFYVCYIFQARFMEANNIKAMFSEEIYVPPTAIWDSKNAYCSLLCHNDPLIISRESMHKHNFGQTLKLQCCGYREYNVKVIKI